MGLLFVQGQRGPERCLCCRLTNEKLFWSGKKGLSLSPVSYPANGVGSVGRVLGHMRHGLPEQDEGVHRQDVSLTKFPVVALSEHDLMTARDLIPRAARIEGCKERLLDKERCRGLPKCQSMSFDSSNSFDPFTIDDQAEDNINDWRGLQTGKLTTIRAQFVTLSL